MCQKNPALAGFYSNNGKIRVTKKNGRKLAMGVVLDLKNGMLL